MPSVIPAYEYPEAFQVDTFDRDARVQYFLDVAAYFGMDEPIVNHGLFHYTLESAIWEMFFRHLGEEAPEFPWTLSHFPLRAYNVPDIYREWRMANGLDVICSWSPSTNSSEDGS
ncbi:hypothetical protein FCOIX_12025 [Fusarium coicis]|nr:hypothetical protein FCOIX_12025 [Fusarium coicis]